MSDIFAIKEFNNFVVAKSTNRSFPGVLMQGDSLKILYENIQEIKNSISENNINSALEEVDEIMKNLECILISYERTLDENNISIPYRERLIK